MKRNPAGARVLALHRLRDLDDSLAANLMTFSAEEAATAMLDRFVATGYIQADVVDPAAVRTLIRRDCRRRRVKVRTYGLGTLVVAVDDARHDEWLDSADGVAYQTAQGDAALAALATTRNGHL